MNEKIFEKFPEIETERLLLRQVSVDDLQSYHQMRINPLVMKFMDVHPPKSIEETRKKITDELASFQKKSSIYWTLTLKGSNEFIGGAGFWRIIHEHFRAELGYQILPKFWRKGFAEEVCRWVINFGFKKMRLHSIEANVNPANIPSVKLLKKLGFVQEAYFKENFYFNGKFLDSIIFSLLASEWNYEK